MYAPVAAHPSTSGAPQHGIHIGLGGGHGIHIWLGGLNRSENSKALMQLYQRYVIHPFRVQAHPFSLYRSNSIGGATQPLGYFYT